MSRRALQRVIAERWEAGLQAEPAPERHEGDGTDAYHALVQHLRALREESSGTRLTGRLVRPLPDETGGES